MAGTRKHSILPYGADRKSNSEAYSKSLGVRTAKGSRWQIHALLLGLMRETAFSLYSLLALRVLSPPTVATPRAYTEHGNPPVKVAPLTNNQASKPLPCVRPIYCLARLVPKAGCRLDRGFTTHRQHRLNLHLRAMDVKSRGKQTPYMVCETITTADQVRLRYPERSAVYDTACSTRYVLSITGDNNHSSLLTRRVAKASLPLPVLVQLKKAVLRTHVRYFESATLFSSDCSNTLDSPTRHLLTQANIAYANVLCSPLSCSQAKVCVSWYFVPCPRLGYPTATT